MEGHRRRLRQQLRDHGRYCTDMTDRRRLSLSAPYLDVAAGLDLEAGFSGSDLPESASVVADVDDILFRLWLALAPRVVEARLDAALTLYTRRLPESLHSLRRRLRLGALRWWASRGASPGLTDVGTPVQRTVLDASLALFIEEKLYVRDLTQRLGADLVMLVRAQDQLDARPPTVTSAPPGTADALLPIATAKARSVLPGLERSHIALWLSATTEEPRAPHLRLLLRCLPQVEGPGPLADAVRRCLQGQRLSEGHVREAGSLGDWHALDVRMTTRVEDLASG